MEPETTEPIRRLTWKQKILRAAGWTVFVAACLAGAGVGIGVAVALIRQPGLLSEIAKAVFK